MAKTDWRLHCATFLKQQDTSAAARRSYCEANGLNANSFRRELANFSPDSRPEQSAAKKDKKPAPKKETVQAAPVSQKPKKDTPMHKSAGKAKGGSTTRIPKTQIIVNTRPNVEKRPNGTRTFTKGNTAGMKHGGYAAVLSDIDLEIDPDDVGLLDMGRLLKTRLLGMSKIRRDRINGVIDMYDRGHKMTRIVIGPDGKEVHEALTLIEALESVEYSGIESFTRLLQQLTTIEEKAVNIEKARRDISAISKSEAVEITATLLTRRVEEELSAMETCHLFSVAGIEPPKLLMLEAEKELAAMEPDPDSEVGASEAELKAARELAWRNRENDAAELAERQKWLNDMLAESGQTGEVRVTDSAEDELTEDDVSEDDTAFLDGDADE